MNGNSASATATTTTTTAAAVAAAASARLVDPSLLTNSRVVGDGTGDNAGTELNWVTKSLDTLPPPPPLPNGWIVRHSRSQPGAVYYIQQETGETQWELPVLLQKQQQQQQQQPPSLEDEEHRDGDNERKDDDEDGGEIDVDDDNYAGQLPPIGKSIGGGGGAHPQPNDSASLSSSHNNNNNKRSAPSTGSSPAAKPSSSSSNSSGHSSSSPHKKQRVSASSASDAGPKEVRVLHLLRKHRGSRRPSSWREATITKTKEEARAELEEFQEVLQETLEDTTELRATMEELARTESDCSSAKRGGDLGYFGRGKMQAPFEAASFALKVGELSDIVETSSGVHLILRIG